MGRHPIVLCILLVVNGILPFTPHPSMAAADGGRWVAVSATHGWGDATPAGDHHPKPAAPNRRHGDACPVCHAATMQYFGDAVDGSPLQWDPIETLSGITEAGPALPQIAHRYDTRAPPLVLPF